LTQRSHIDPHPNARTDEHEAGDGDEQGARHGVTVGR
jgi:hypothetical protein